MASIKSIFRKTAATTAIALLSLSIVPVVNCRAQSFSFSDLFGQASKQKQYYLQQIAAYQVFKSELEQGYGVVKNGLKGIAGINTAELNLHSSYYSSMSQASPAVKGNPQIQDIITWQREIIGVFSQSFAGLTPDELTYAGQVKALLLEACTRDMNSLQELLAAGEWQMTDDQRLKQLEHLHESMLDQYRFSRHFTASLKILAIRRQQETNDSKTLMSYYEND